MFVARLAPAADPPPLLVAHGKVDRVEKDTLSIQPREASGKFGKHIQFKVTGTSKVTTLTVRETGGKMVVVQRDTELRDLKPGQAVAVVYTALKDGNVLLSAVVQP
jgi:hypothetical protein